MKKALSILVLFTFILMTSCSKNEIVAENNITPSFSNQKSDSVPECGMTMIRLPIAGENCYEISVDVNDKHPLRQVEKVMITTKNDGSSSNQCEATSNGSSIYTCEVCFENEINGHQLVIINAEIDCEIVNKKTRKPVCRDGCVVIIDPGTGD